MPRLTSRHLIWVKRRLRRPNLAMSQLRLPQVRCQTLICRHRRTHLLFKNICQCMQEVASWRQAQQSFMAHLLMQTLTLGKRRSLTTHLQACLKQAPRVNYTVHLLCLLLLGLLVSPKLPILALTLRKWALSMTNPPPRLVQSLTSEVVPNMKNRLKNS